MPDRFRASDRARRAFLWACALDVSTRKPGNVSLASPGHGMDAALFLASAQASAGPLFAAGAGVGERIEGAVRATQAVAGCNTNLGILLLCAPLAAAVERGRQGEGESDDTAIEALQRSLAEVLGALDLDDARCAYAAIALAHPAGLGRVAAQDVATEPTVDLGRAMALAESKDRIAWQYGHHFADIFERGLPAFARAAEDVADDRRAAASGAAMQAAWLEFVGTFPDSHIARKHGDAAAQVVLSEARVWREQARASPGAAWLDRDPAFADWDDSLKRRGLNPGTSADLAVATAMTAGLVQLAWNV